MKINLIKAAAAGIAGTVVFDLVGYALTGKFWDIPNLPGSKLFEDAGLVPGVLAHYSNGILLGILYAAVAPSLFGNRWSRAAAFMAAETIFGVYLFMMPLLGAGPFGYKLGASFAVITMARHLAFGATMAWLYPKSLQVDEVSNEYAAPCACSVSA